MTGRVEKLWRIFEKNTKELKMKSHFLANFAKMGQSISILLVILSFMKFFVARTFIFTFILGVVNLHIVPVEKIDEMLAQNV